MPKRRAKKTQAIKIKPKTKGQEDYIESINIKEVTICDGFAGTGKTLLAVGKGLQLIKEQNDIYNKIIMVRPAVVACDEELGFLPGDLNEKMAPFVAPMIDSMRLFLNDSEIDDYLRKKIVEIWPIAYMRGRTLNNCVVIFDESQNSTPNQMKMFLTRIGRNCKTIIEGDKSQTDLNKKKYPVNGLEDVIDKLKDVEEIGIISLEKKDIIRSKIVSIILDKYENNN